MLGRGHQADKMAAAFRFSQITETAFCSSKVQDSRCSYEWQLTATEPEAGALGEMLGMCTPARTLTVVRVDSPQTPVNNVLGNYI